MTGRSADWAPLAERDPVPGDAVEVLLLARRYRDTAELLRDQAAQLRRLAADTRFSSEAWQAFEGKAPAVADHLEKALVRFEETSTALRTWGRALDEAQVQADTALVDAKRVQARLETGRRRLAEAQDAVDAQRRTEPLTGVQPDLSALRAAEGDVETAQRDLARCHAALQDAVDLRDWAARRAAQAIDHVVNHDGLKDGRWDKLKGAWDGIEDWVGERAEIVEAVSKWAGIIATGAALAALAVGWVPVIGQAAAAVLGTVALTLTAVALLGHLLLAGTGNGSWLDVGLDAFALATFGIGRAFSVGARTSYVAARAQARVSAYGAVRAAEPGLSRSTVYLRVNAMAGGKAGAATATQATIAEAGTSAAPRFATLAESFRPTVIARETADAWRSTEEVWRGAQGARAWSPNMDLAAPLGHLGRVDEALTRTPEFMRLKALGDAQRLGWASTTVTATAIDGADKAHTFDRFKPAPAGTP